MAAGKLPLLTKGPFALFYGGEVIIPLLSTEPAGSHFSKVFLTSVAFLIFIVMYKKMILWKLPTQQRLKERVVSNFLNIFTILIILISIGLATFVVMYHYRTIKVFGATSEEGSSPPEKVYWKNIEIFRVIETMLQSFPFITNHALR